MSSLATDESNSGIKVVKPKIFLADLTYTQQTIASDVMPNAIGGIATYTESLVELAEPVRLFKYPEKLAAALDAGKTPDIVGFSNYIWNRDLSYQFARRIKACAPNAVVVFGGPNYPVDRPVQAAFLERHPAIDFYIEKEGEAAFAHLVGALVESRWDVESVKRQLLPSVHSLRLDGTPCLAETRDRIVDLTEIPSPYTTRRMDEFFDGKMLPIIQTNRGCPFSCTFCVEGDRFYNKVRLNSHDKVSEELDYIGRLMAERRAQGGRNDLFIADSNFGMYKDDIATCRKIADVRDRYQWPEYINVATGKNSKERVLEAARLVGGALRLSGSVQSLDAGVLENIKRSNISAEGLMDLGLGAAEAGANSYSEIILALPGDSRQAHLGTIRTVMDAGFTNIYLFQLMLLPGTELATDETIDQYGMDVRYRVLPRCYGHFDVLGEPSVSAEIEEICVANKTLSFENYLDCRRFHLIVTIFYNDGVFATLLKMLRMLGVSVFRWMELLNEAALSVGLEKNFDDFRQSTRDELWDRREDLERFVREPGNVEKYIAGELGNNLIFVHKTRAITGHVGELAELAGATIQQCLAEDGMDSDETLAFVDDALTYHTLRLQNIFTDQNAVGEATLSHDVAGFDQDSAPIDIDDYRLAKPRDFRFILDEGQKQLVRRYLGIYGDSTVGIGRILSKVYVRALLRQVVEFEVVASSA